MCDFLLQGQGKRERSISGEKRSQKLSFIDLYQRKSHFRSFYLNFEVVDIGHGIMIPKLILTHISFKDVMIQ